MNRSNRSKGDKPTLGRFMVETIPRLPAAIHT